MFQSNSRRVFAFALTLALAPPAGAFELAWPVDCRLGDTCHIQHYVDRDPGPGGTTSARPLSSRPRSASR